MKTSKPSSTISHLDARLAAYAAAGVAIAAPVLAPSAKASVVSSGPISIAVPANNVGVYLNLVTGMSSTTSFAGYDFNPYGASLNFFTSTTTAPGAGVAAAGTVATAFSPGATISSSLTFATSVITGTNFRVTGTEYAGIKFTNETTSAINYGWIQLTTTGTTGQPATITAYAYENSGAAITIPGAVPEPTTNAALGLGALAMGAVAVRRMRKNKQAVV